MAGKICLVLCFLCVTFVNCQFGLFSQRENNHRRLPIISGLANTIGNIFRPNQNQPIVNNPPRNQDSRPGLVFPTSSPEEAPVQFEPSKVNVFDNSRPTVGLPEATNNEEPILPPAPQEVPDEPLILPEESPDLPNAPSESPTQQSEVTYDSEIFGDPPEVSELGNKHGEDTATTIQFAKEPIFRQTCNSVNNLPGQCVVLVTQCPRLYNLLVTQGNNPEVKNMLRQVHCGFEQSQPKVCCPLEGVPTPAPTQQARVDPPTPAPRATDPPQEDQDNDLVPALPSPPECGFSNVTLPRVVGGMNAKLGAFPWMALLGYRRGSDTQWKCGGSLITRRHVLTAAHCVFKVEKDLYVVRLGELDLASETDGASPIDILIKKKVMHENYDSKVVANDIAMITLEQNVQFTHLIKPICMPSSSELRSNNFENYRPFVAGWGAVQFRGEVATHLQFVQLPVLSVQECRDAYIPKYPDQQIDQRTICAGFKQGKKDACSGDSGGPLMQPSRDATGKFYIYQTGVVSYGKGCGLPGFPGVYTRVTEFLPWIARQTTGRENI